MDDTRKKKHRIPSRSLRLSRETLRRLDRRALQTVAAGDHPGGAVSQFEMCD